MLRCAVVPLALMGVVTGVGVLGVAEGAIADEVACFMTTADGRTLSLSHMCGIDVPVGAYLADPEPVPDYATAVNITSTSTPARQSTVSQPTVSQPRRDVSQELPNLGVLPTLPPMDEF